MSIVLAVYGLQRQCLRIAIVARVLAEDIATIGNNPDTIKTSVAVLKPDQRPHLPLVGRA